MVAHSTLTQLKAVRDTFAKAAQEVKDECYNLCARPFDSDVQAELAPVDTKATSFCAGLDVDASSAAGLMQDAVQFMLPIIKALTLAELQTLHLKTQRASAPAIAE